MPVAFAQPAVVGKYKSISQIFSARRSGKRRLPGLLTEPSQQPPLPAATGAFGNPPAQVRCMMSPAFSHTGERHRYGQKQIMLANPLTQSGHGCFQQPANATILSLQLPGQNRFANRTAISIEAVAFSLCRRPVHALAARPRGHRLGQGVAATQAGRMRPDGKLLKTAPAAARLRCPVFKRLAAKKTGRRKQEPAHPVNQIQAFG